MGVPAFILGLLLIVGVLWDAFETIVLPRRVARRFRFARFYFAALWRLWTLIGGQRDTRRSRWRGEGYLSLYGPLSLIGLLGTWAVGLIVGFGLWQWALGSHLHGAGMPTSLGTDVYMSGTTFFTLGIGDVTPTSTSARCLTVLESGVGFGFLALIISYLPVLYQAFSKREVSVSLLDARAGSPPTALEMLTRGCQDDREASLTQILREWEQWSAELLESHLSYPILAYFRSQHDNQSWVAGLAAVLDTCALVLTGLDGIGAKRQARLTFAIARHAAVDLAQILNAPLKKPTTKRLPPEDYQHLRERLCEHGFCLSDGPDAERNFADQRTFYEPYIQALANHLLMPLPPWIPADGAKDDWQSEPSEMATTAVPATQALS
jgi:hypothetical protein